MFYLDLTMIKRTEVVSISNDYFDIIYDHI